MSVSPAGRVRVILSLLLCLIATAAVADSTSSAVAWLNAHQNADSSWGTLPELAARDTARVLLARQLLGTTDPQALRAMSWLSGQQGVRANQFLSEQALALAGAKLDPAATLATLAAQHAPAAGDFGGFSEQSGDTFDSALAIEAFALDESTYAGTISGILTTLTQRQNVDGGWGLDQGFDSNPVWTAEVLIALSKLRVVRPQASMVAAAQHYLITLVHADGSIGSGVLETAVSLRALVATAYTFTAANASLAYLTSQQSADGSWSGSAYLTARALEAFAMKKPNLTIVADDVTVTPKPVIESTMFTVNFKVRNTGLADAPSIGAYVSIYDRALGGNYLGTFYMSGVPALGSISMSAQIQVSGVAAAHDIVLSADAAGAISELQEDDNNLTVSFPLVARADLQLFRSDIVVTPAKPQPGQTAQMSVTIRNAGGTDAGAFDYVLYDSVDGAPETVLARGTIASLAAGAAQTVSAPFTASAGTHTLHAVADSGSTVTESSETNNDTKLVFAVSTTSNVDLVLSSGSVTSSVARPAAGTAITITANLTNAGSAPADTTVAFYDGVPGAGGTRIATVPASVDIQATTAVTTTYVTTATTGVIYAVADPDNALPEIDERNNQAFVVLTDTAVDLSIVRADILVPKAATLHGQPVAGRVIVRNKGTVAASNVDIAIYDDLPQNGGIRIVNKTIAVPANGTTVVPFTWSGRAGQRYATVVLNASRSVAELDYTNDRATHAYNVNGTVCCPTIYPDGSGAIDLSELVTDSTNLTVRGDIKLQINSGGRISVTVFEDVDGDRAYDPDVDNVLGSTMVSQPGYMQLRIPVDATVRSSPAHLIAYLDSTNALAETDETDNFLDLYDRSCQSSVQTFAPVVKWRQGLVSYQMPAVARLVDTNGDGVVDDYDVPTVVAVTGNSVYAFRGDNGQILWSASSGTTARQSTPTIGDVDGDGKPEVIIHGDYHRMVCLNGADGSVKWTSPELDVDPTWLSYFGSFRYAGSPLIADLNGDGHPEVISGRSVLNGADGTIKWVGTGGSGRSFPGYLNGVDYYLESFPDQEAPIAADLNGDGKLELIAGNTAYRADGTILWQRSDLPDGSTAMWGRNVVLVAHGKVYMLKPDGTNYWAAPVAIPGGAILGGAPTVIWVGQGGVGPTIAVAGDGKISSLSPYDGSIRWTRDVTTNFDRTAVTTTNALGGFYSFGVANLAYISNQSLYVFNAWRGELIYKRDGGTSPYYPGLAPFADVDGDGIGDLVTYGEAGLQVLSDPTWDATPSIFNELSYHETNVSNDRGLIPAAEAASGNYRVATSNGARPVPQPNFTASYPRVDMRRYPAAAVMTVRIGNNGWAATPPSSVNFYRVPAGSTTPVLLGNVPVDAIAASGYRDVSFELANPTAADLAFYAIVNQVAPLVAECNTTDNQSPLYTARLTRDIVVDATSPTISDPRPSQNDVVTLVASARYSGAIDASTPIRAQFFAGNPSAGGVAISPLLDVTLTSSYQQYQGSVVYRWTVSSAVGAQDIYVVFDPQNLLVESDETNNSRSVRIDVGTSEPQPKLASTLTLNPAAAEAGTPVNVGALVQNIGNVKLQNVTLLWTATGANTGRTFSGSAPLASLAKNAVAELALGTFTPPSDDTYRVAVTLSDSSITSIATPKTIVIGRFVGVELSAIPQRVPLSLPLVQCHARVTRTNTIATFDDPLIPLIKAHLQQGITWETRAIAGDLGCFKCHAHSFALVNFSTAKRISGVVVDDATVDAVRNLILKSQGGDGQFGDRGGLVTTAAIGAWALSTTPDTTATTAAILKSADALVAHQSGAGNWNQDGVPAGSYNRPEGTTMVAVKAVVAAYERSHDPRYLTAINRAASWLNATDFAPDNTRIPFDAARIGIALAIAQPWITDPGTAAAAVTRMKTLDAYVRSLQNSDGSFGDYPTYQYPVWATAQCLYFLTLHGAPPTDPAVRKATIWLLNVQRPDGNWALADGNYQDQLYDPTSWAMIALPAILDSYGTFAPDLHLTLPSSTLMSAATPKPTTQRAASGGTEYIWSFPEPTDAGADVYMTLKMSGLADGATTPVASAASITYNDPYSKLPIQHDVAVPSVTGYAPIAIRVTTDKNAYAVNAPVAITETIDNVGTNGVNLTNSVSVVDGNGTAVAALATNEPLADVAVVPFPGWHFAAPATLPVPGSGPRFAQISVDFAQQLGANGAFDANSIRVSRDSAPSDELAFTFLAGARPDTGVLVVAIPAAVTSSTMPVHVFFDTTSNGFKAHSGYDLNVTPGGTGFWWTAGIIDEAHSGYTHANQLVLLQPLTGSGTMATVKLPYNGLAPDRAGIIYNADMIVTDAGTYAFTASGDDIVWIEVDGVEIIGTNSREVTATKMLTAGTHHVRVTYFNWNGNSYINAYYTAPNKARQLLGDGAFFPTITGAATPLGATVALSAGGTTRTFTWNTGLSAAGTYKVSATVRQDGGIAGRFDAPFTIGAASAITLTPSSDRTTYDAGDIARLSAAIAYADGNVALHNLTATLSVISPAGAVVTSSTTSLATLTPGQTVNATLSWATMTAAAGTYALRSVVRDAAGATLATSSVPFAVRSSASTGSGLTGSLVANGNLLTATVTNGGNAALSAAPFRIEVLDGANASVATLPFTLDLAVGATATRQLTLDTSSLPPGNYTAFLVSLVGNAPSALASAPLQVAPRPVLTIAAATDKSTYVVSDTAHVTSTIAYTSGPGTFTGTVTLTAGATTKVNTLTLTPGQTANAPLDLPITSTTAPGTYTVTIVVRDAADAVLTQQSIAFTVGATPIITGALTTDASIVQGSTLHLTATLTNSGNAAVTNAPFAVTIGSDTLPFTATIAPGASVTQQLTYATTSLAPGTYSAKLNELATATFTVAPIPTVVTAMLSPDQPSYGVGETAHITSTVTYASGSGPFTGTATLTSGTATKVNTLTLAVGQTANATLDVPITAASTPGSYTATVVVRDATNAIVAQQSASFAVAATPIITGTLTADASVVQGSPLHLTATVTNSGNAAVTNAPFVVTIGSDTLPFTATVAPGASVTQQLTYATTNLAPGTYSAKLNELATATFTVTPIPTVVTATLSPDKPSYGVGETAHIASTITYATGSGPFTGTATLTSGTATKVNTLTLAVGQTANATVDVPITAATLPGSYTATVVVRDATNAIVAQQSTSFIVNATPVITGTLTADATVVQGSPLHLTTTLTNSGNAAVTNAPFVVTIGSATLPFTASVAPGGTITQQLTYATTTLVPATYTAQLSGTTTPATTMFTVTAQPVVVTTTATTDKSSYDLGDTAHIAATITYVSGSTALANATATISVSGGATSTTTFATLAPGASATATLDQPIAASMAPGSYVVTVTIRDATGAVLTQQTSTFTIISSAVSGKGISGTLAADATVTQGAPLHLTAAIANHGNAALTNAPFRINILNPSTHAVVDTIAFTATVAIDATTTVALTDSATATLAVQSYDATLLSAITTTPTSLATTSFTVRSAAQFALTIAPGTTPRVVIWANCSPGNSGNACTPQTPPFLTHTLEAAGIPWTLVGDEYAFLRAIRSGGYSAAILDQSSINEASIAAEYLDLVHAGIGFVLIDTTPDANPRFAPALQTSFGGRLHGPTQLDLLATPFTTPGRIVLNGDTTALKLEGARAAANITATQAPAITYATYGLGRVIVLPFDVELTTTTDVAKLLVAATSYVSRTPTRDARQVVPIDFTVTPPAGGGTLTVDVRVTLPQGMSVVAASPSLTSSSPTMWTFTGTASTAKTLTLWVRLPETAGAYTISAAAGYSGQLAAVTQTLTLTVTADRAAIENALAADLVSLQSGASAKDAKTLADAKTALDATRAMTSPTSAGVTAIINQLLAIRAALDGLAVDASTAIADDERLLMYWASRV
jgi:subtilase family serine protease/uncharacterized membrane protein